MDQKDAERILQEYNPRYANASVGARECLKRADEAIGSCNSRPAMQELLNAMRFREDADRTLADLMDQKAPDKVLEALEYESLYLLDEIEERVENFAVRCDCRDRITGKGFAGYSRH